VAGCSLAYASYDGRFAPPNPAPPPLVTDGDAGIAGLAVTDDGVFFYATGGTAGNAPVIKRVSQDGGGLAPWWAGDAGVTALAGDGAGQLTWVAGGALWVARTNDASATATLLVDGGLLGTTETLAADATRVGWIGNVYPGKCPPGGCVVAFVAPWGGGGAPLAVSLDASTNVSPHTLSVDALGVMTQFDAERSTLHLAARFAPDGGLACLVDVDAQAHVFTTATGALFAFDPAGNVFQYATTAEGCPTKSSTKLSAQALAVVVDNAGVYWVDKAGDVYEATPGADAGTPIGAIGATAGKAAIAVGGRSVYVASGASIFRLSKTPGE
jgi:hypothetical protein